jgi:cell division protease FtsH
VDEARDKVLIGLEREGLALTDREIRLLSFHEAGHAVLAAVLPHGSAPQGDDVLVTSAPSTS